MPLSAREYIAAASLAFLCTGIASADPTFERSAALATSQAAIGRTISNHRFITSEGDQLRLADLSGRPVVISLIFTSCYHVCPLITQQLAEAVAVARDTLRGNEFDILTIGFDSTNDTPARMRSFARERGIDPLGWHFLSADAATIEQLAAELGFIFFASPRGFDHLAQITILDQELRVYHQIYGDSFVPPTLIEPLKRLALGIAAEQSGLAALLERVRLLCTVYDPASGKYHIDNSLFIALGTGLTGLLAIAIFIFRAWRENTDRDLST